MYSSDLCIPRNEAACPRYFHDRIIMFCLPISTCMYLWAISIFPGLTDPSYTVGGFNVSNLMGITWRKIDIGKKITFYFLQNVWKCTVFFAFAFKVWKKCYYDPKKFFLTNIIMGIKKRRILCWFQIRWCRLKQMPLKIARAKKPCEFWVFSFLCIFRGFLLLTFVRCISESRHQRIWNQHKILRILDTHNVIFQEKKFLGHISTFCIL